MIGRLIENADPTLPILEPSPYDENGILVNGIKNGTVALYTTTINSPIDVKDKENVVLYPTGKKGVLHQDLEYLLPLASDRNIYVANSPPADVWKNTSPSIINVDADEYLESFRELSYGIHDESYKPYLSKYMRTLPALELRANYQTYKVKNGLSEKEIKSYFPDVPKLKYTEGKYDSELIRALRNPERYLDILRKKLTLDEDTGYYSADGIGYICQHEWMMYEGKSLKNVLELCANEKGCCKHCGAQLFLVIEDESINFDGVQYRLIYLFLATLDLISYEEFISFLVRGAIQHSINELHIDPLDDYAAKTEAFTAAYCYKLIEKLEKVIKLEDTTALINYIHNVWRKSGWDDETTAAVLANDDYFLELSHCISVIKSFKDSELIKDDTSSIVHVLMDGMVGEGNAIQRLYLKDKNKIGELVDLIILSANNYTQLKDWNSILKSSAQSFKPTVLKMGIQSLGLKQFFLLWWKGICPVATVHDFNKGTCKHCGINDKNVIEIYEKYEKKLIEMFKDDRTTTLKQKTISRDNTIADIKKAPLTIPKFVPDKVMSEVYIQKLRRILEQIVGIGPITELEVSKDNNCRIINWLLSAQKITGEQLKSEILSVTSKPMPLSSVLITKF